MFANFFEYLPPLWSNKDFVNMFGEMPSIFEKLFRTLVVYGFLVVILRSFGKRKLTQLNPFDFVVLLLLSNTVQNAIIGNETSLPGGLIGALFLILISNIVVALFYRLSWRRRSDLLDGKTTILIENGKINDVALRKEQITPLELESIAHDKGFNDLEEIKNCVLEPNGKFFVEGKDPSPDERRHQILLNKIEELSRQVAELKAKS
ncbi:MAG: YetF domain-containing protein [Pyrinomonadaceae bacterium]